MLALEVVLLRALPVEREATSNQAGHKPEMQSCLGQRHERQSRLLRIISGPRNAMSRRLVPQATTGVRCERAEPNVYPQHQGLKEPHSYPAWLIKLWGDRVAVLSRCTGRRFSPNSVIGPSYSE